MDKYGLNLAFNSAVVTFFHDHTIVIIIMVTKQDHHGSTDGYRQDLPSELLGQPVL